MDELNTAPEPQATETEGSEALAAAANNDVQAAAASADESTESAATAPAQISEPDLDALIERHGKQVVEKLRKRRDYAGMLGRDEHNLKREQEERLQAEAYQKAMADLRAQEDEARRRRELEEMPDEDYGRFLREQQRQDQFRATLAEERDRTWVGTLGKFLDDDVRTEYHRPGRWATMDDYVAAVIQYRVEKEAAARTETDLSKIRAEMKEQVLQELNAEQRSAYSGSNVTNGTPVGVRTQRRFKTKDEVHAAHVAGEITTDEARYWLAQRLPYAYDLT